MKKIRVLIADDHRVVREGLSSILRSRDDIEVVAEAENGLEAVEKARKYEPDVVLMDISMPRMNGVEAARLIKKEFPRIGIVVLTMFEEEEYIFDMIKAGATGYILKDSDSAQIIRSIRSVAKGESLIHPSVASKILTEFSSLAKKTGKVSRRLGDLTEREITVLQLVAEGKTNKEIAVSLSLAEKTIKNHVRNIFKKLSAHDRTEAAIFALRKGLIELHPRKGA